MKIFSLWLYIIFILLHHQNTFSLLSNNGMIHLCRQEQSQLLLQVKQKLPPHEDYMPFLCPERPKNYCKTMFWSQSSDCCQWDGVTCDESTGYVIGLDLSCGGLGGNIHSNSSLFRLTRLRNLNLARNNFMDSEISSQFRRLNSLTHLNLSFSGFTGQIPLEFYYLSNLVSLDRSSYPTRYLPLKCDIKTLFRNMTKIRVLLLQEVNISSELPMNMSSSLIHLDLENTGLYGKLPVDILEKSSLQILILQSNDNLEGSLLSLNRSHVYAVKELELSTTSISGRLPESIGFMRNLNYIGLFSCKFSGPIPESIGNITEIIEIILSGNEFSGQIPSTISNLRQLIQLDLRWNHLEGQVPESFSNLQKLTHLSLGANYLVGLIPSSLTNMSQLEWLDLSSNALTGLFPSKVDDGLQKLSQMDLSHNSIQGMIPSWLFSLPSLENLNLSSNRLTGQIGKFNYKRLDCLDLSNNQLSIPLESFYNLSNISTLLLSHNTVTEHAHEIVNVTLSNLILLELSSCEIKEFPVFLKNLPSLYKLDLSNNKIHGPIPSWLRSIPSKQLSSLDLSKNYLSYAGHLPWQYLQYLNLHSNSLEGTFPSSICNMSQLYFLDLSNNKLRGKIPECIGNSSSSLWLLDLRRNEFQGKIPATVGGWMGYLGLNGNHLQGPLPRSLANFTSLEVLDLGNNIIHDTFPWWLETLPELRVLILKSNRFHGSIRPPSSNFSFTELRIIDLSYYNFTGLLPKLLFTGLQAMENPDRNPRYGPYLGISEGYKYSMTVSVKGKDRELPEVLTSFTAIDLSNNDFHGRIPESIAYLNSLKLLNLSHNNINGSIPPTLGRLTQLEQLDLSSNQLTGGIPQTLTNLTFLADLNLSYNHLVGPIPEGHQFSTFSNESYIDNSGLCGAPLTIKCGNSPPPPEKVFQEEDDFGFLQGFTWKAVVMGYGCGIVLGFILGNIMISIGKPKWLARFVHVEAAIYLNRRKKRGHRRKNRGYMVQGTR